MKKKRVLVLTDNMPWGHRSIARAIYGFLKEKEVLGNYAVDYAEVKMLVSTINDVYTLAYRYLPVSNKLTHRAMENGTLRKLFLETTDNNVEALRTAVEKYHPDLIISCYFLHSHSLVRWRKRKRLQYKLWTVAADPWTVNTLSFVDGADMHLVYDDVARKQAMRYGISKSKITETGWWTRGEMYDEKLQTSNLKLQIKEKMGIEEGEPVVFIGGGSLGTSAITKFLPVLLLIKQKCTIIFNTGTDKFAYRMVEQFRKIFNKIKLNKEVKIINLGWIDNMAQVLSVCDIVFGKAGPNFLFDVVASQKPFVAITHIGGQEDGNIKLILKKKLGWVKEGLGQAEDFLIEYLKNPKKYNTKYSKTIELEAKNNQKSMDKIWEMVQKCPTKS